MDFIVLGLIPGTHLQITFEWLSGPLLAATAVSVIILDAKLLHNVRTTNTISQISLIGEDQLQSLRRINAALQAKMLRVKSNLFRLLVG